jgi:hypothetical protein
MPSYRRHQHSSSELQTWYATPWIIASWGSEVVFAYKMCSCCNTIWLKADHCFAYVIRNTLRRRSSRLNPGSYEMLEVSCETLHMDTDVPSSSSFSVPELNNGNDMVKYCYFISVLCCLFQQLSFSRVVLIPCYVCWYNVQQGATQGNTAGHKVKTPVLNVNWFHS